MDDSDVRRMSPDEMLFKIYKTNAETEVKFTNSFHKLGIQINEMGQKLEQVPTSDQVKLMFGEHTIQCRKDRKSSGDKVYRPSLLPGNNKLVKILGSVIAALTVLIVTLIKFL